MFSFGSILRNKGSDSDRLFCNVYVNFRWVFNMLTYLGIIPHTVNFLIFHPDPDCAILGIMMDDLILIFFAFRPVYGIMVDRSVLNVVPVGL